MEKINAINTQDAIKLAISLHHKLALGSGRIQEGESLSSVPSPDNMPPNTSGLDPSIPSDSEGGYDGDAILAKLNQFLQFIYNNQGTPDAVTAAMNLVQYITNLNNDTSLSASETQEISAILNTNLAKNAIANGILQMQLYAFFKGYNGTNGNNGNTGGETGYINDLTNALNGGVNKFINANDVQPLSYFNQYIATNGTGDLIWNATIDGNTITYDWTNPNTATNDQSMILSLINNATVTPSSDDDFNTMEATYRVGSLNELLKQFGGNSLMAIMIWLMLTFDSQYQSQEGGLATTTNILTDMTNKYTTPLLNLAQNLGNLSGTQADQFKALFFNGTVLVNSQPQLSTLASTWNTNVVQAIGGIQVTLKDGTTESLETALTTLSGDALAAALNSIAPASSSNTPSNNGLDPTFSALLSQLNSDGSTSAGNDLLKILVGNSQSGHEVGVFSPDDTSNLIKIGQGYYQNNSLSSADQQALQNVQTGYGTLLDLFQSQDPPNPNFLPVITNQINALNPINPKTGLPTPLQPLPPLPPPTPAPDSSTTSGPYQSLINALQQAGGLFADQSKTVATEQQTVAGLDNQAIKLGSSAIDPKGAGLVALMNAIIQNQISH